jgi:hypothetical protein
MLAAASQILDRIHTQVQPPASARVPLRSGRHCSLAFLQPALLAALASASSPFICKTWVSAFPALICSKSVL